MPELTAGQSINKALSLILEKNQTAFLAGESIASRGNSYGVESIQIDGNDVEAVFESVTSFKNEILTTNRPKFIEAVTYRYRGHSKSDRNLYW